MDLAREILELVEQRCEQSAVKGDEDLRKRYQGWVWAMKANIAHHLAQLGWNEPLAKECILSVIKKSPHSSNYLYTFAYVKMVFAARADPPRFEEIRDAKRMLEEAQSRNRKKARDLNTTGFGRQALADTFVSSKPQRPEVGTMLRPLLMALSKVLLLLAALHSSAGYADSGAPTTRAQGVEQGIRRGMAWIDAHPASLADTGLLETLEELITFYLLKNHSKDASDQAYYRSQVEQRQRAIVPYIAAQAKTRDYLEDDWSPVIYLLAAHIMDRFGQDISGYRVIIQDILAHYAALYTPSASAQLWTALYLERLGYVPPPPGAGALKRSRLVTELSTHELMNRLDSTARKGGNEAEDTAAISDLIHEVFALTDFGALAPPVLIAQHRPYFTKLFGRALQWASAGNGIDILAELLICTELLHLQEGASQSRAVDVLLQNQREDGTFGPIPLPRSNPYRHGVLTSVVALSFARH